MQAGAGSPRPRQELQFCWTGWQFLGCIALFLQGPGISRGARVPVALRLCLAHPRPLQPGSGAEPGARIALAIKADGA